MHHCRRDTAPVQCACQDMHDPADSALHCRTGSMKGRVVWDLRLAPMLVALTHEVLL
jgi:hypothetical protein